ncbi:hypothetical protein [Ruegeria sp. HKCCD4318-2]|uniref:hypothetical protein n=1 Tax=Ruegeria sp. HKCCD4318-2 TaxID=2683020 RepID=UPI001C10A93E|nr:hypothetical protein [Ruegeria sp. HKCCD4318-2]
MAGGEPMMNNQLALRSSPLKSNAGNERRFEFASTRLNATASFSEPLSQRLRRLT